jgi:hypothetical protein
MTFVSAADAPMDFYEEERAVELLGKGEITVDDLEWLMGKAEPEPVDLFGMTAKERRRYFAIQAAQNRRAGITPQRRRRKKKAA